MNESSVVSEKHQAARYDAVTIVFHWLTAVLVVSLFCTAMGWTYTPREWGLDSLRDIHVSLGVALATVVVGRIVWRLAAGRHLPETGTRLTKALARIVHIALYVLLVMQVGPGIGLQWSSGEGLSFFGLLDFGSPLAENRDLGDRLEAIHNIVAWTMMALVFGHASAAILHRFVAKDDVLKRMLP